VQVVQTELEEVSELAEHLTDLMEHDYDGVVVFLL
jgi:hypothetical protein